MQQLITCGKCKSQFDISKLTPGSNFVCAKCRATLTVPGGGGAAGGGVKLPSAMQKRASTSGDAPARAGGGAASQAPPAKPAGGRKSKASSKAKGSGGSARRARPEPAEKSGPGAGLYIGIGAAVLLIAGGAFVVMSGDEKPEGGTTGGAEVAGGDGSSDGTSDGTSGGGLSSTGSDAATAPAPKDHYDEFLALSASDRSGEVTKRIAAVRTDPAKLEELYTFFSNEKLSNDPAAKQGLKRIGDEALKLDSSLEWARQARGERNALAMLEKVRDEASDAFRYADDDENAITAKIDELSEGSGWVDATVYAELEALASRVTARAKEITDNPIMRRIEDTRDWTRKHELLKTMDFEWRYADPYVVFQQINEVTEEEVGDDALKRERLEASRQRTAERLIERDAIIFQELERQFRSLFAERFKLPTLQEKNRLLKALILYDKAAFQEFARETMGDRVQGIRAYYSPTFKHIIHYVGEDALRSQDEFKTEQDRVQKGSDQVTFHEGTHQLMHEYGAIFRGQPLTDTLSVVFSHRSMWFSEGIAEFMGAVEISGEHKETLDGVEWSHNRILLERVSQGITNRRQKGPTFTIAELLAPRSNEEMNKLGEKKFPNNGNWGTNIFYAQGWGLCHFLWFYDGGKYREHFFDFMEAEMRGTSHPGTLGKLFGLKKPDDWGDIEKEYQWYWRQLMKRPVGVIVRRGQVVKTHITNTDPPAGAWSPVAEEDDDGGGLDLGDDDDDEDGLDLGDDEDE